MMVGRSLKALFGEGCRTQSGARKFSRSRISRTANRVKGVSLSVRAGEIVGLGGLVGAGRTELVRLIFGAEKARRRPHPDQRQGVSSHARPEMVSRAGIGLVSGKNRKEQGVILDFSDPDQCDD